MAEVSHDLAFKLVFNKPLLTTFTIKNSNPSRLAFKVKTTAAKKYVVRPGAGIIDPNSAVVIQVIMQAQSQCSAVSADKFMVQICVLGDNEQIEADTFLRSAGKALQEAVLRVRWEAEFLTNSMVVYSLNCLLHMWSADPDGSAAMGIPVSTGTMEVKGLTFAIGNLQHENDELRKQLDQLQSARKKPASCIVS